MFSSLLVANRGEIACRVFRTARRIGLRTIAVYSEADRNALHTRLADESHFIGPAEASSSYLNFERIFAAARASTAAAIHPGYGFLSENPDFAEACAKAGIIFVGPTPSAMRALGLKDEAKSIARQVGVPVIPGYDGEEQTIERFGREAKAIGFPIIIKATAGGGGRGMRIVENSSTMPDALKACRREALAAFGNDRMLLERYFPKTRHIEVQVMADSHGGVVHLFERDCSIQRRHQKIIEEAPAHGLSKSTREDMYASALALSRHVAYRNAGTVEFLYDEQSGRFYFMEMNTRLQVEHPVTEMITGLDLVELQLRVAAGEPLPISQAAIEARGHAIEARLYAEDPAAGFLPQSGRIEQLVWPAGRPELRIETGVESGSTITSHYDPMIAKLIGWGGARDEAIRQLESAISETLVFGLTTNKAFLGTVLNNVASMPSMPDTRFLDSIAASSFAAPPDIIALALVAWTRTEPDAGHDAWSSSTGWTLGGLPRTERFQAAVQNRTVDFDIVYENGSMIVCQGNDRHVVKIEAHNDAALPATLNGAPIVARFHRSGSSLFIDVGGHHLTVSEPDYASESGQGAGQGTVRAPMSGRVLKVETTEGAMIGTGDRLFILEAMKMEHILRAAIPGRVANLTVIEGGQVKDGEVLCVIVPD